MRILVVTQAVDLDDPVLGFFHGWLRAFSGRFAHIHVVCLREGRHELPENVVVHSLGKERAAGRLRYLRRFYSLIWRLRREYDAVFIHMNAEYVLLGTPLWRMWGTRVVLWRNHRDGGIIIRVAALFSHVICYTSPHAFVARYGKAVQMPVGIDTSSYAIPRKEDARSVLFLGRVDPVKKLDIILAAFEKLSPEIHLDIYGSSSKGRSAYMDELRMRYRALEERGSVRFHGDIAHAATPRVYASHKVFVNLTQAGSFDKTIFEAMSAGCLVVTSNPDIRHLIRPDFFVENPDVSSVAAAIRSATLLDRAEAEAQTARLKAYVKTHDISALVERTVRVLQPLDASSLD